jgi:hypothetical protein
MSTGHLEGRLSGKKAKEIFNAAKTLSKEDLNYVTKQSNKQTITKYTICIPRGMGSTQLISTHALSALLHSLRLLLLS